MPTNPLLVELLDRLTQGVAGPGMHASVVGLEGGPVRDAVLENLRQCERLLRQASRWVAEDKVTRVSDLEEAAALAARKAQS